MHLCTVHMYYGPDPGIELSQSAALGSQLESSGFDAQGIASYVSRGRSRIGKAGAAGWVHLLLPASSLDPTPSASILYGSPGNFF